MEGFAGFIINKRKVIIVFTIVVTLVLGYFVKDIKINSDITSYLPKGDPTVKLFNYIGKQYAGSSLALVVLETDDIFNKKTIEQISNLTSKFKLIDGVSYVTSLANVLDIKKVDDWVEIRRLIDEYNLPVSDEELHKLKNYTLSKDMYRGKLVSNDSKATLIICRLNDVVDDMKTVKMIKETIKEVKPEEKVYYGGFPFLMTDIADVILNDLKFLVPIVGLLIVIILFFSFRTLKGVILPVLSVLISTIWTIGIMSALKIPLTIVSNVIPVILIAVGSAYSIHVVSRFNEEDNTEGDRLERFKEALSKVGIPVFLAAVTTIAGFTSFVFGSYLTMIREFGIFTSLGVLFALINSITFVPAILSTEPLRKKRESKEKEQKKTDEYKRRDLVVSKLINGIINFILKNKKAIVIVGVLIVIINLIGIPRIQRKVDIIDYFRAGSNIRLTEEVLNNKFGGSTTIQVLVKGDILAPAVLAEMKRLERFLESKENVNHPQSVADFIEEMSYVIGEGRIIPDSREKVVNLWFFLEGQEIMEQMVNSDKTEAIIQATIESGLNTEKVSKLVEDIESYIEERNSSLVTFALTGMPSIHRSLDISIKQSQIQSLIIAVVLVFILIFFMLRSFVGGLIGLIPIGFALTVIFGFMGLSGIPLDIATVLVGSISIGVGIDYSIHFLSRFRQEQKKCKSVNKTLRKTMETTGKAILINVLTVMMGFLVLVFADIVPLKRFGILAAITMLSSGFGAIILLPAIMLITNVRLVGKKVFKGNVRQIFR